MKRELKWPRTAAQRADSMRKHGPGGHTMIYKLEEMEEHAEKLEAELHEAELANLNLIRNVHA